MKNDPRVRAGRLQNETREMMQSLRLQQTLEYLGGFVITGSCLLDMMVYPDLNLYAPMASIRSIFTAASEMAGSARVIRVTLENEEHPTIPVGLFLNLQVDVGEWRRAW